MKPHYNLGEQVAQGSPRSHRSISMNFRYTFNSGNSSSLCLIGDIKILITTPEAIPPTCISFRYKKYPTHKSFDIHHCRHSKPEAKVTVSSHHLRHTTKRLSHQMYNQHDEIGLSANLFRYSNPLFKSATPRTQIETIKRTFP